MIPRFKIRRIWLQIWFCLVGSAVGPVRVRIHPLALRQDDLPCSSILLPTNQVKNIKGTVQVISSDLPLVEWHVRFKTLPFKPLSVQGWNNHSVFAKSFSSCWTNWAGILKGHSWLAGGCYRLKKIKFFSNIFFNIFFDIFFIFFFIFYCLFVRL